MRLSPYCANLLLNFLRGAAPTPPSAIYLSAHTADPGTTGASEATNYTRQAMAMGAASAGAFANTGALSETFTAGAPSQTIAFLGAYDAATGGNFLFGLPVGTSKTYAAGDTATEAAGAIAETLS